MISAVLRGADNAKLLAGLKTLADYAKRVPEHSEVDTHQLSALRELHDVLAKTKDDDAAEKLIFKLVKTNRRVMHALLGPASDSGEFTVVLTPQEHYLLEAGEASPETIPEMVDAMKLVVIQFLQESLSKIPLQPIVDKEDMLLGVFTYMLNGVDIDRLKCPAASITVTPKPPHGMSITIEDVDMSIKDVSWFSRRTAWPRMDASSLFDVNITGTKISIDMTIKNFGSDHCKVEPKSCFVTCGKMELVDRRCSARVSFAFLEETFHARLNERIQSPLQTMINAQLPRLCAEMLELITGSKDLFLSF